MHCVQPGERIELGFVVGMSVNLQRDGQTRVAEDVVLENTR
jgi:hypothetical protein